MGQALRETNYDDVVIDLFKDLKTWLKPLENLQQYKDNYSLDEMNVNYVNYMLSYKKYRDEEIDIILANTDYFNAVQDFAKENILFDILIDGYSIDVNRAKGTNRFLPILPYPKQLELIDAYQRDSKSLLVEKSRRAGASLFMSFFMRRGLIHKDYFTMLTSHQDIAHLDAGIGDILGNSTFGRVTYMMDRSIFVPDDWKNDRVYNTKDRQNKRRAMHRQLKKIVYKTNTLIGVVLGKGTGTGDAVDEYFSDEFDVVCDKFPNQADNFLSAVAPSVERVIIYSTYRSVIYPMYQIRQKNDLNTWSFIKLRWQDNPTCNQAWFDWQSGKLGSDTAIARELGIDPTAAIKGRVFKNLEDKHFIDELSFTRKFGNIWDNNKWLRIVGGDNGADQNYTLIFVHRFSGIIYYYKNLRVEDLKPGDVSKWAKNHGFGDATFLVDIASKQQHGFRGHAITSLLRKEGLKVMGVNNKDLLTTHAMMRLAIEDSRLFINKSDNILSNAFKAYRYDYNTQWVYKDSSSHIVDGCCYGYKGQFQPNTIYTV